MKAKRGAREVDSYLLLALFVSLLAALPLLIGPGIVNTRAGGDSPFLLLRVHQLADNLRAGTLPARWMPDAAFGLGYPAFCFYAAFPYYVAAILSELGLGLLWGIKLTQTLGFLLAGAMSYLLARELGARRPAALLASALFTFAPFHLVNVYVRGDSLSEFWAMALYPAILWSLRRLARKPGAAEVATVAASYALLILSHNISALVFSPLVGAWLLVQVAGVQRGERRRVFLMSGLGLVLGLLLSAWFWLTALRETPLVQLGEQTTGYFHFGGHFRWTDLVQWSPIHSYLIDADHDPFGMGLVQAGIALLSLGALLVRTVRRERPAASDWLLALALLGYTWLITPWSRWVWEQLPLLEYAQFPWRLLSVQALLVALVALQIPRRLGERSALVLVIVLCLAAGIGGLAGLRLDRLPVTEADITPERLMLYETYSGNIGSTIRHEYLPREMVPRPYASAVQLNAGAKPAPLALAGRLAGARLLSRGPEEERWQIDVLERALLAFHTTFYPGWEAIVDGRPQGVEPLAGLGLLGLRLEAGQHEVRLHFDPTPTRRYASWVSLVALVVWLLLGAYPALASRRYRRGLLALLGVCALLALATQLAPTPRYRAMRAGPLIMDWARAPYLHHEPEGIRLGAALLLDYELRSREVEPGEVVELTMRWQEPCPDHRARVLVVAATAHLFEPAPVWAEAQCTIDATEKVLGIALPEDLPPGLYLMRLDALCDGQEQRIETVHGVGMDRLALAPIQCVGHRQAMGTEPVLAPYGPPEQPAAISLLDVQARPEDGGLALALTWRSERQASLNYYLSVRLKSADGTELVSRDLPPLLGGYPASLWQPGEIVTDRVTLPLPPGQTLAEDAQVEIVLYDRRTLRGIGSATISVAR